MKFKTTKKEVKESCYRIIGIGYCDAQYLLRYRNPVAYSAGTYGWQCDYYDIDGVMISTGYGHLENKNVTCNYDIIRQYDKKAAAIVGNNDLTYEQIEIEVNRLLSEFIAECIKQ